jgi:hypothetical protein
MLIVLTLLLIVCRANARDETKGAEQKPDAISYTGTLKSVVAIGGETTGWQLEIPANKEKKQKKETIDVEVSKVKKEAEALDGKQVTVTGKMTVRQFPERGKVKILVAEKIENAEKK